MIASHCRPVALVLLCVVLRLPAILSSLSLVRALERACTVVWALVSSANQLLPALVDVCGE